MTDKKGLIFKVIDFLKGDESHPELGENGPSPISKHGFFEDIKDAFGNHPQELEVEGNDVHFHIPGENITLEALRPIAQNHKLEIALGRIRH